MSSSASGMPSCAGSERLNRSREGKGANYYRFHCNDCYETMKARFHTAPRNVLAEDAVLGEMQESMESSDLEGEQMARNQLKSDSPQPVAPEQAGQTWISDTQQTGNGDNNMTPSQLSYRPVANDIKEEPVDEQENSLVTSWNSSAQLLSSEAVGTDAEVKDEEEMMLDNTYGPYPLSCTLASEEDWQGIDPGNYYNTNTQSQFSCSTAGVEVEEEGGHDQTWMNRRSSRIASKEKFPNDSSYNMYSKYEQETVQNTCEHCRKTFSSPKWLAKHLKTHMPTYKQEQKVKKSVAGKVKKKRKQTKRERRERFRALAKRSLEVQGLGKGSRSKPFVPPYEEAMRLDDSYNINRPYPFSCTLATEEDWQGIDPGNCYNTNTQSLFSSSTVGVEVEEEGGHDQTWMNRRSSRIASKETLASSYMYNKYEQETAQNTCELCRKMFSSPKWLAKHLETHMPTYKQEQKVKKSATGKVKKKRKQTKRERRERFRALAKRSLEVQGLGKGSRSKPFVPPYEEAMRLDDSYNINRPYPLSCTLATEEDWQGIDPGNYYNTNTQSQFSCTTAGFRVEEEGGHDQTWMNRRSSRIASKETLASSYMYNKYEQETAQNTCEYCRKTFSSTKWLSKHLKTHLPAYKQEQKVKKSAAGKVKKKRKQTKRERRERYRALARRSQEVQGLGKGSRSKPFVPPVGYKVIRYEKSLVMMTPEKTRIRGAAAAADLLQERGFKKSLVLESSSSEKEEPSPSADMEGTPGNTTSTTGQPGRKTRANKKDADWLEETERIRQLNKRKQNRKKGKSKTSWVCKCKEKFTSKTSYNQHRLEAHPLTCEYCEENFRSRQLLNKHLKTHMPSEDKLDLRGNKLFLCDHCGQFFTDKKLQWHKLKLNEVKMYECVVNNCEATFRNRAAVQNHIATVHNRNRFPCPHEGCKQTFGERSRLKSHYKVHTDERRYQCSYCGKMFRRSEHMRVHMRIHTGDNPFNCSLCNYSGRQYNSLRWHMKTHHPERCENSGDKIDENSKKKVLENDTNALADKDESDNGLASAVKRYSTRSRSHRAK